MQPHLRRTKTRPNLQKELPQTPQYRIRIRTHNNKTFFLNVGRDCEVRQLKEILATRLESFIPAGRLKLFTGGVEMDDEGWVFGHQLDDGDSIFCIAALGSLEEERKSNTQDLRIIAANQKSKPTTTSKSKLQNPRICRKESSTYRPHIPADFPSIDSLLSQFEETQKQNRVQSTSTTLTTPTITTLSSMDSLLSLFEAPNTQKNNHLPSTTSPRSSQPKSPGRMDSPTLTPSIIFNNGAGPTFLSSHKSAMPHERKNVQTGYLEVPPIPIAPEKRNQYEKNRLRSQTDERVYEMEDTTSRTHKIIPVVPGRYLRLLLELYRDRNQDTVNSMQLGVTTDIASKARAVDKSISNPRVQPANVEPKQKEIFTSHSFENCPECQYYLRNLNPIHTSSLRCPTEEGSNLQGLTTTPTTLSNSKLAKEEEKEGSSNSSYPTPTLALKPTSTPTSTSTSTPPSIINPQTNLSPTKPVSKPQDNPPSTNPSTTTEKKNSRTTPTTTSHVSSSRHSSALDPNFAAQFDAEYLRLLMDEIR